MKRIFSITVFFLLVLVPFASARDIRFEVTVDKNKVSIGDTAQLNLSFYGAQDISAPDLPDIHGFDWRYLGPSTRMSIVNGRVSSSITHMYILIPLKVGEFTIPPFSVYYRGKTYTSEPIPIEVVQGPSRPVPQPPAMEEEPSYEGEIKGLEDRVFLRMETEKSTAYVNEPIPVTIKLYIDRLSVRDIEYPEFAHGGFLADEFGEPRQFREVLGGVAYHVIEFRTNIWGMRPGEYKIGPAELKCNLLVKRKRRRSSRWPFFDDEDFFGMDPFDSFFGGYVKYPLDLKSFTNTITIVPLPQEGIPPEFDGAVGEFQFRIEADPKEVKAGDPITLKMTVTGTGNFNTVKLPHMNADNNFKVYDPQIKQDRTGKTFEQVIIPKSDMVKEIPPVTFAFFDTRSGEYKRITRGPIPITVNPLPKGEKLRIFETAEGVARAMHKKEILGRDIIYIKDTPGGLKKRGKFLCQNKLFVIIQFFPISAVIFSLLFAKRRQRLETDIPYARRLRAPRRAKKNLLRVRHFLKTKDRDKFFEAVFKTLQEYIGDRFHLSAASITESVVDNLARYDIEKDILDKLRECFSNCDMARYAPSEITDEQMDNTLKLLESVIEKLERLKR